jgi:hypothetical protein
MQSFGNRVLLTIVLGCAVCGFAQQAANVSGTAIRGWLSDEQCARARAESGAFTATNPKCAKECVAKGKRIVLIDPDQKRIFAITNQTLARKNVGDYVEISGQIDVGAKTIRIASLKMLAAGTATCDRPQLKN